MITQLIQSLIMLTALLGLLGCTPHPGVLDDKSRTIPTSLQGEFEDDYGIRYTVTKKEWYQHPDTKYHIVHWRVEDKYFIARNDSSNPSDPGLWTRIDWMTLTDMYPFEWAFCMSAYDSSTALEAESTTLAQRGRPMDGCNGFPFSRMKRH